ncbi:2-hydroxyacid dehydrogenase [Pseudomonas wayambapalatensis]|nr:2-hydroxyacid dehydrogenase [Pseudomonas wayambapalatensis]
MSDTKPLVLSVGPLLPALRSQLEQHYQLLELWRCESPATLRSEQGADVQALVTTGVHGASAHLIEQLPALRAIVCFGVGTDAVDLKAARARGIQVSNTPDVLNDCVAGAAMALLLAVARQVVVADRFVRAGRWEAERFGLTTALGGKTCGIVGMGPIGQAIARRASAFGMQVNYSSRTPKPQLAYTYHDSLLTLAECSDFLVLAVPGGSATDGLVSRQVLEALGPTGMLVNVARGSVVDQYALIDALSNGRIAGAALDVFADEPHVPAALRELDTVVLSPNVASGTKETRQAMADRVLANLAALFATGVVLHPVPEGAQ